jgi:hypothetical protein
MAKPDVTQYPTFAIVVLAIGVFGLAQTQND